MSPKPAIIDEYVDFVRHHRALTEGTISVLRRHVESFLLHLGKLAQPLRLREVSPATSGEDIAARLEKLGIPKRTRTSGN